MNWDLIPEAFYDFIARLVPGSLFLVGAFAVHFGPKTFAEVLASALPSANLASLLLFGFSRRYGSSAPGPSTVQLGAGDYLPRSYAFAVGCLRKFPGSSNSKPRRTSARCWSLAWESYSSAISG
jgi:hypothetical protein